MGAAKILIVEDEGIVGLELAASLAGMGYEVAPVAADCDEALAGAASFQPDLVLMDIRLSGPYDGIETAARIRERFRIPVIYLTAHSDEDTIQRAKLSESFGYLLKPFEPRALRAAIETALYKAGRDREREAGTGWSEAVGEYLPDGLVLLDAHGIVRYCNRAAAAIAGRAPEACRDRPFEEIFPAADPVTREPVTLPLTGALREERSFSAEKLLLFGAGHEPVRAEYLLKPVKDGRRAAGAICLLRPVGEARTREREMRLELERTGRYQIGLLPEKGRSFGGVRCDWIFRPGPFGSGDIFNVFPLDDRHVGFYLLDVMGHGFPAAVLAVTVYSFLSNDSGRVGLLLDAEASPGAGEVRPPAAVMAELNRRFYFDTGDHPFFTLVYGVIDVRERSGRVARAGHVHPLHVRPGRPVERLESRGQAIGAFPEIEVEEKEFEFFPGCRLILCSDGLLDVLRARDPSGAVDEGLIGFLDEHAGDKLSTLCAELDRLVLEALPAAPYGDDVAFLGLEMGEESAMSV